jgi:hypothetical protein
LFVDLVKIDHAIIAEHAILRFMALAAEELTFREFASLLAVGDAEVHAPSPAIPAEHCVKLIALGYMADLEGRLRMTTPGRVRIAAGF